MAEPPPLSQDEFKATLGKCKAEYRRAAKDIAKRYVKAEMDMAEQRLRDGMTAAVDKSFAELREYGEALLNAYKDGVLSKGTDSRAIRLGMLEDTEYLSEVANLFLELVKLRKSSIKACDSQLTKLRGKYLRDMNAVKSVVQKTSRDATLAEEMVPIAPQHELFENVRKELWEKRMEEFVDQQKRELAEELRTNEVVKEPRALKARLPNLLRIMKLRRQVLIQTHYLA